MKKLLVLNLLWMLLLSCSHKDNGPLVLETREVDFMDKTGDEIKAKPLDLEVPGVTDVVVYDSLLIFVTSDPSGMLQVFNKNTLKHLASFCQRGRAQNEMAGKAFLINEQYYLRNGDLIIPLMDNKSLAQKEFNISASLREGHTVVENTLQRSNDDFESILLDNGLERSFSVKSPSMDMATKTMTMPVYAVKEHNRIVRKIEVFKEHVDNENPETLEVWYRGGLAKHPDRNLVVMAMGSLDYLLFFDLDKDKNYAVHQKGTPTAGDVYVYMDYSKNYSGGLGGPIADRESDMFFVLYFGGKYTEEAVKEGGTRGELLLFDWDGNYLGGAKMDTNYHFHSYDPDSKLLYAVNFASEKIYTFNLSGLMKSIKN